MRRRLTSAWTDVHVWLILTTLSLIALTSLTSRTSGTTVFATEVSLGTLVAAFVVASFTDAFGGMIVGLVAAAGLTAMRQYLPDLPPVGFVVQATTMGLLLMLGLTSGLVADRIRRGRRIAARQGSQAVAPVLGSLGLISATDAEWILGQERARAELHGRPLTTARIEVVITDPDLTGEDVRRAARAAARTLETELRVTDVIYADGDRRFGVILPETDPASAADIIESALIVARSATFADRASGHRRPLSEVASLDSRVTAAVPPPVLHSVASAKPVRRSTKRRGKPSAKAS